MKKWNVTCNTRDLLWEILTKLVRGSTSCQNPHSEYYPLYSISLSFTANSCQSLNPHQHVSLCVCVRYLWSISPLGCHSGPARLQASELEWKKYGTTEAWREGKEEGEEGQRGRWEDNTTESGGQNERSWRDQLLQEEGEKRAGPLLKEEEEDASVSGLWGNTKRVR